MRTYYTVRDNDVREAGSFTYSGQNTGVGLTDFMLGRPTAFEQQNEQFANIHASYLGMYLQDDIKLTPRLSVNLGLRYEIPFSQVDEDHKETVFLPGSTARSTVFKNAPAGLLFFGDPGVGNAGRKTPRKQFGPRVGLSYALTADQKTVLRAGYGLLYNPTWTNVEGQYINRQPWVSRYSIRVPFSTADPWRNQASFPGGNPFPVMDRDPNFVFRNGDIFSYLPNYTEPNSQHWNLNLQRELAHDYLITMAYVGTKGTHQLLRHDRNAATYVPGASTLANLNDRRPFYPPLTIIEMIESSGKFLLSIRTGHAGQEIQQVIQRPEFVHVRQVARHAGRRLCELPAKSRELQCRAREFELRPHAFLCKLGRLEFAHSASLERHRRQALAGWQVSGIVQLYSGTPIADRFPGSRVSRLAQPA